MGASDAVEEALWWLGWHRRYVLSTGVAAGFVSGYAVGGLGVAGLAAGLVVAGGLVYGRRVLALEGVVLGGLAAVAATVGFEAALSSAGVEGPASAFVGGVLSLVGFDGTEPLSAAEDGATAFATWYFSGLLVGALVWSVGAAVINRTYADTYGAFRDVVEKKGVALLGEGTHTTMNGSGSLLGVRPNREYHATNIRVRQNSVDLNYGSALSMPRKAVKIAGSTKHLYYDQLSSVDYDEPYFEIRMAGGEVVKVVTEEEPSEVLDEIEENLGRYKKAEREERRAGSGAGREEGGSADEAPSEEAERRAEEALEDIEGVESVFESAINEMVEDDDVGTKDSQVEVDTE